MEKDGETNLRVYQSNKTVTTTGAHGVVVSCTLRGNSLNREFTVGVVLGSIPGERPLFELYRSF